MSNPTPYATIPSLTFDEIPGSLPPDLVPQDLDLDRFPLLAREALENLSVAKLSSDALWRDFFSITGRVRTFSGSQYILQEWGSYTAHRQPSDFQMNEARVSRLTPTTSWVDVTFNFVKEQEGGLLGNCFGIVSFVPHGEGNDGDGWKVWMLRTMLENFSGYGHPDDPSPIFESSLPMANPGSSSKSEENTFDVVIIGAGQSGLSLAGRLGALGVKYLLLEKEKDIGYSWTGKYDSVRQHTVKEMNNLPFERTYRADDPILLPAATVAEGFKNYVEKYKINMWLAAETTKCSRREDSGWDLSVRVGNGDVQMLKAKHLVLSMGGGVSVPNPPDIQGIGTFTGDVLHMGKYKNSHVWTGKNGVVIGSGTTAHDVAQDMLDAGLSSVTMVQRGKTPVYPVEWIVHGQSMVYNTDIPPPMADRLVSLMPLKIEREMMKINLGALAAAESARFDALEKSGFQVDRDAVLTDLLLLRGGGYYIDVGTSKRIADGEINVKSGIKIKRFTDKGLAFEDGEEVNADVVVFATGYQSDARVQAAIIIGDEVAGNLPYFRGLDGDGEIRGSMRPSAEGLVGRL